MVTRQQLYKIVTLLQINILIVVMMPNMQSH
jgi:hypothetical protein